MTVTLPAPAPAKAFTRSMRVTGVLFLTLSAVTPASSVFVVIPGIIQQAGTGAFISMGAAAVVALAMAYVYAELASAYLPSRRRIAMLGRALDPFVGFVFMGMNVIGSTLPPAILALGASAYLTDIWPGAQSVPVAGAIVAATTVFGILNIRLNAWVTGAFLLVEVVALVVLTVLGFSHIHRGIVALASHPVVLSAGVLNAAPVGAIGLATAAQDLLDHQRLRCGGVLRRGDARCAAAHARADDPLGSGPDGAVRVRADDRGVLLGAPNPGGAARFAKPVRRLRAGERRQMGQRRGRAGRRHLLRSSTR